ncbi:MAG: hypothetical protein ACTH1D_12815 [Mycobacteriaceae bacterium]
MIDNDDTGKHHKDPDPEKPQQGPEDDEQKVDEWEEESVPASDPPANY